MKKNYLTTLFLLFCGFGIAQNPICPPGLNIADPTTRVWKDGKLYLYGSRDESLNYYGSYDHWVLSTSDLLNWEFTPNAFASKGPFDQVPFNDDMLYAPDCMYKNGMYYLYFCQPGGLEGVATSTSPTGPFTNPKELYLKKKNQIDPAVFIDDDGQAYYTWGQFQAKIAKLKPNMTEIDTTSIVENVITEKEHFFHEGNYMVKRNGIYYMVYADMSRKGMPTCIGYATSKSPMGPYKYGGVIIDNDGCDPNNWNNHGSIVEFKGQWYVFYHRTTHGVVNARKACIEPIYFNEDGSINEVEMTSQGAGKPLDAFSTIEAERACLLHGQVRIESYIWDQTNPLNPDNNNQLGQIKNNDRAVYKYINFGDGATSVQMRVAPGSKPGKIIIRMDNSWEAPVGTLDVPGGGNGQTWELLTCRLKQVKGVHALHLSFVTEENSSFNVDRFVFGN
ncbi:MAG: family 43 glycosylhydrolase [Proteiniphilum sp.]|nr:family 43 glycosylhydrolase [Proteiniphilum sp.]